VQGGEDAERDDDRMVIVGLNSEAAIRKIKGPSRPIVDQESRSAVLASLSVVDMVIVFDEETPEHLIRHVRPDIQVKGADWEGKSVAGSEFVQSYGGQMEFLQFVKNYSTTRIIQTIIDRHAG
jgi:D-beta-D-heptose 7-phosphate kinase/D-beta-D-heptose 1-phosphate adenosyltransferase